jgi:hypothetical protein
MISELVTGRKRKEARRRSFEKDDSQAAGGRPHIEQTHEGVYSRTKQNA